MILTTDQIADIVKNNPQRAIVAKAQARSRELRKHMYGEDLDKSISIIEGFEKEYVRQVRAKYCRSNKDLFSRLGRPVDKVFNAKGGSVYYNLSDALDRKVSAMVQDIRNGLSLRKWIEQIWRQHLLDDPCGIILLEILPATDAVIAKSLGRSVAYPVYKSIMSVHDYLPKGNKLEYISFELTRSDKRQEGLNEDKQVYRIIDDSKDYYVQRDGENVTILTDFTLDNYFGEVPAMLNSDIIDPLNDDLRLSLFDDVLELANDFFTKGSIKTVSDMRHGFPKYAEFASDCGECLGSGYKDGVKCNKCLGTGKVVMSKPSDVKMLPTPSSTDTGTPIYPKDVAAYIEPPKTFHDIVTADLAELEKKCHATLWGTTPDVKPQGASVNQNADVKTATEVMSDMKPQEDRLRMISEMAEVRHKFLLDHIVRINITQTYKGSSVNYGRRYIIERPDAIWEKYSKARTAGSPISVLDDLLYEYYESKYAADPVAFAIAMKLAYVEPFVHYRASEVKLLSPSEDDYKAKLYFSEWLSLQSDALLIQQDVIQLKQSLTDYASEKQLPQPAAPALN